MAARLEDDPLLLAEPANFDPLYSAVRHFGALGTEARDRTQEVIGEALKGATLVCKRTINAMGGSDDELAERRQLLRLAAFLQSWLVREAEKLAAEALPNAALAAAAKPKKGGKKGAAVAEKGWSWSEQRESALVLLLHALELDLGVLWERCTAGLKLRPPLLPPTPPLAHTRLGFPEGPGCACLLSRRCGFRPLQRRWERREGRCASPLRVRTSRLPLPLVGAGMPWLTEAPLATGRRAPEEGFSLLPTSPLHLP